MKVRPARLSPSAAINLRVGKAEPELTETDAFCRH